MKKINCARLSLLLLVSLSVACATVQTETRSAVHSVAIVRQASFTPAEQSLIDGHCPQGMPEVTVKSIIGPTHVIVRTGYVLEHSSVNKIPLWVCEGVSRTQLGGNLPRTNPFAPDPTLNIGERAELKDYKGSGFDRGIKHRRGTKPWTKHSRIRRSCSPIWPRRSAR